MGFLGSIVLGVVCLTVVILLLIGVLMFAESKLVQKGKVKILINDDPDNSPEVDAGSAPVCCASHRWAAARSASSSGR